MTQAPRAVALMPGVILTHPEYALGNQKEGLIDLEASATGKH